MRVLRWILCVLFALGAVVSAKVTVSSVLESVHEFGILPSLALRGLAADMILLAVTIIYAMACVTFLLGLRSARGWNIAASTILFLMTLLVQVISWHTGESTPLNMLAVELLVLAAAVAGIAAFWRRDCVAKERGPEPVPGDGTHPSINRLVWPVAAAACWIVTDQWSRWASTRGLLQANGEADLVLLAVAIFLVLALHEGGHALAGRALGMKVCSLQVGPLFWSCWEGHWKFAPLPRQLFSMLGMTQVVPVRMDDFRRRKFLVVAAGPAASIATGLAAAALLLADGAHLWNWAGILLSQVATVSLVAGPFNLAPLRIGRGYSDGAKLYQLLREGPWVDYHTVHAAMASSWVGPLRARDYDVAAIFRATETAARGADEIQFRLAAVAHYFDCGLLEHTRRALSEAESALEGSGVDLPAHLLVVLTFYNAFVAHDARRARDWWEKAVRKSPDLPDERGAASLCALLLEEGRWAEANEVWPRARAFAEKLPRSGAGDLERETVASLRCHLDESGAGTEWAGEATATVF